MLQKNITGIILAGGNSRRMGQDKGLIVFKEKTFIEHIIDALLPLVGNVVVVSDRDIYNLPYPTIKDVIPNSGPLAGLYSGLNFSKTEYNLVLSCDVPLVTTDLLQQLLVVDREVYDIVQFESEGKATPLVALYRTNCKEVCLQLLESGERRLTQLASQMKQSGAKVKTIVIKPTDEVSRGCLKNINFLNDLSHLPEHNLPES